MALRKKNPFLALANSYFIDSPQPSTISYWWNIGSTTGTCTIIQTATGIFTAMHYSSNTELAFISVEHIMRDVSSGWATRYAHANGAAFFFITIYAHMARGIYYGSYKSPRVAVWVIGVIIFTVTIITGFTGYVLPMGQMSTWGATVITNTMSAIPYIGQDVVEFIWGGPSVGNPTLQRFFATHYTTPFVTAATTTMHTIALHEHGSSNPTGITGNIDRTPFSPYFVFKDTITVFVFTLVYSTFVFFNPNTTGHPDNYIPANPMVTPASIVPEFYTTPFYAITRAIPSKTGGVIAMVAAITITMITPISDRSIVRGNAFKVTSKVTYGTFTCNFTTLGATGSQHIEAPFIATGQFATVFYFAYFIVTTPAITMLENITFYIGQQQK
uniref:apocytochrome b n=1 Tax=Magnusiomyces suaveolens TaxID=44074 RepID=UPI001BEFC7FD|nr:apocytochrome b [Saprochaete suaveolens]QUV75110.1 apocytochrome b [Saprochaete suaveolens]